MFNLINMIFGEVFIEIDGTEIEKLLNVSAKKRIHIRNLRYKCGIVSGSVTPKDFKRIRIAKRGIKARVRITKKKGLAFVYDKHSNRTGFLIGAVLFLVILKFMSLFIWNVSVVGNKNSDTREIVSEVRELGLKEGVKIKNVDTAIISQKLLLKNDKLSWASVNIEGCFATVNVSESKGERAEEKPPSNLIATADGTIEKIDVTSGRTVVSVGDTVAKGDVIVSGVYEMPDKTVFENSKGKIIAKTVRTFSSSENFMQNVTVSCLKKQKSVLGLFFLKIPLYLGTIKESYTSSITQKNLTVLDKKLPIWEVTKTFNIKKEKTVTYSKERLLEKINENIDNMIKKEKIGNYGIIDTEIQENEKSITVKRTVTATENIAKEEIILIKQ